MKLAKVDPLQPDPDTLAEAAAVLWQGGLVAFPTETVYGLGVHALDATAVRKAFTAKGRPSFNPLIVHVHDIPAAQRLVSAWPESAERLARAFWPGPLTLVLPKNDSVPPEVTAGLATVAIRIPSHPVALELLRTSRLPLAAPSANRYSELSPTTAEHVAKGLGDRIDLVLDAGATAVGIESTVVDLSGAQPRVLRPGSISAESIVRIVGQLASDKVEPGTREARPSPGLVRRHYSPRARVHIFGPEQRSEAVERVREARGRQLVTGGLLLEPLDAPFDHLLMMPVNAAEYASRLYASLHKLDDLNCDIVLIERVPPGSEWAGVRDRLTRAAELE